MEWTALDVGIGFLPIDIVVFEGAQLEFALALEAVASVVSSVIKVDVTISSGSVDAVV